MRSLLAGLRVVELADDAGAYVGKLLGDAGALVVRIEPKPEPYGWWSIDPSSSSGRFLHQPKQRLSLCLDSPSDLQRLRSLLDDADIVIESGHPTSLRSYGVNAEDEVQRRPAVIWARITPFGVDGPLSNWLGSDLVCAAAGGFLALAGYPDEAPTRAYGDQALRMAALHSAVGIAMALLERDASGHGQLVDVSIQEAVATALENSLQFYDLEGTVRGRTGQGYAEAGSGVFTCQDGLVYLMVGRLSTKLGWQRLVTWMTECHVRGAEQLLEDRWQNQDFRATPEAEADFRLVFEDFASTHPAFDLYSECQQRGIILCPISTPDQLIHNEQLSARNFFGSEGEVKHVGPPYQIWPRTIQPNSNEEGELT